MKRNFRTAQQSSFGHGTFVWPDASVEVEVNVWEGAATKVGRFATGLEQLFYYASGKVSASQPWWQSTLKTRFGWSSGTGGYVP